MYHGRSDSHEEGCRKRVDTQQTAVFSHDIPTSQPNVAVGWLVGVAVAWTALATAVAVGAYLILGTVIANEAALWVVSSIVAGIVASAGVLTLISRRITREHLQQEATLHGWREVQQLFLDNMPQGVFWKDRDRVYLGCNQLFATMGGLDRPSEVIGLTDYDLPWSLEQTEFFRKVRGLHPEALPVPTARIGSLGCDARSPCQPRSRRRSRVNISPAGPLPTHR
jgi:PAS domain-containing protein